MLLRNFRWNLNYHFPSKPFPFPWSGVFWLCPDNQDVQRIRHPSHTVIKIQSRNGYLFFLFQGRWCLRFKGRIASTPLTYLSKNWGLLLGMTKWVDLPSDFGSTTFSKGVLQEGESCRMLIYDRCVVSRCFVVLAPTSHYELQST